MKKSTPEPKHQAIRLGVIGCGVIAQSHLQAAAKLPGAAVTLVADLQEERARQTAEKFGVKRWTTSAHELIADRAVDAVVLAMPTCERTRLALEAFRQGKHVLTEKPVAMNAAEVGAMLEAQGSLVGACCSSRYRSTEAARVATELVASGALGTLRALRCRHVTAAGPRGSNPPPPWRLIKALNGGGILMNWGCYDLDYLLGIAGWGLTPRLALAQTWTVAPHLAEGRVAPGSDAETHVAALVLFNDGVVLNYERAEFFAGATEEGWQIVGTKGSLRLRMVALENAEILHDESTGEGGVKSTTLWKGNLDMATIHAGPLTDFVAAIREGRRPRTSLKEALIVQKITDAIYRSARHETMESV